MRGFGTGDPAIPVRWFDEFDSTNAEARRRAEAGETGPLWIAARRQTAGRGRRGRSWDTAEGNLAATLLATTDLPPAEAAQLSFVTALAVGELVRAWVPPELVAFKWPNDVLLAGGKVSGILIESGRRPDGDLWLAVGVGVNLAAAPDLPGQATAAIAAHLRQGLPAPAPEAALEFLSASLARQIAAWRQGGFEPVRRAWLAAAMTMGRTCTARLGETVLRGTALDLDADGALLLRLDSGEVRRITAGDVILEGS